MMLSRREFVSGTGSLLAAATVAGPVRSQGTARFRRYDADSPEGRHMLDSFRRAVGAMLALPESDPRNWYRNAFVHALDCPHGNWWFLAWHRGYLGWFERTCRELSGDPQFALPYWDWTKTKSLPTELFDGILNPEAPSFIKTYAELKRRFDPAIRQSDYFSRSADSGDADGTTRFGQLLVRGVRSPEDFWFDVADDPRGRMFFEPGHTRRQTKAYPDLGPRPSASTSADVIKQALGPTSFQTFASPSAPNHAMTVGLGLLENEPHNKVHNDIGGVTFASDGKGGWTPTGDSGGFMQAFFSPLDPVFYLHHANLDRLWDVWTRKQQATGGEVLPQGADRAKWAKEPFLFFVDEHGRPAPQSTAGKYAETSAFDYDYQPGSGEDAVPTAVIQRERARPVRAVAQVISLAPQSSLLVHLPARPVQVQAQVPEILYAQVTIQLDPEEVHRLPTVFVRSGARAVPALSLALFGHHGAHGALTWTVPLSAALEKLGAPLIGGSSDLLFYLVAPAGVSEAPDAHAHMNAGSSVSTSRITAVSIEAH